MTIDYDGRVFRPISNTDNGEVSGDTRFAYRQRGRMVWADYAGGDIQHGHLLGLVADDGSLDVAYHHVNASGALMTGVCHSTPEVLPDGRIRLHERWRWTSGDGSTGTSVIEECGDPPDAGPSTDA